MQSIFLRDRESRQLPVREKGLYVLIACFFLSIFLPGMPVVGNVVIALVLLYSFFFNPIAEKKSLLAARPAIWGMLLFFLIHVVSAVLSENSKEGFEQVVRRLPLIVFPLAFGTISISDLLKKRIYALFVLVLLLAAICSSAFAIVTYFRTENAAWLYNDALTYAIDWQSSYVAVLVTMAIFIIVYLLRVRAWPGSALSAFMVMAFLVVFHFLLASRMSIFLLYTSLIIYAVYSIVQKKALKQGVLLIAGLGAVVLVLLVAFPKTINRFKELGYTKFEYTSKAVESHYGMEVKADQWNGANIRLAVWQCGWEVAKQHLFLGTGLGDKIDDLYREYARKGFEMGIETKRNYHSNYLDILAAFGITGLIVFLLSWLILPFVYSLRNRDIIGALIITLFAIGSVSETYFDRSQGSIIFGFLIPFIISYRKQDQQH